MPKDRSPNYPALSLETAVQRAKALYEREGRSAVAPEVAVKAWGYRSLSGPSRSQIAALRHYGLIEQPSNGNLRLSNRALALVLRSPDSPEYQAALRDAALTPALFRELYEDRMGAS